MRTTFVSTASLLNTPRLGTMRMQADLVRLNKEAITGRMSDVGRTLGADAARSVTLHIDTSALTALSSSNGLVATRLEQSQASLTKLRTGGDSFLTQLVAARADPNSARLINAQGLSALTTFIADMNATDGRNYLFAGINTSAPPIADYDAGPQAAIDTAFQAEFGLAATDVGASAITAAEMNDFLDNEFAALFADPAWGNDWSAASSDVLNNRISPTETVETSVSANETAMRKLAMVYSMVAGLATEQLSDGARNAVLDRAIKLAGEAVDGITSLQARLGAAQNRVTDATERLATQKDILERGIGTLEGVDAAEAKVRIDTLTTQIEMSYALTAKLLQMSILNYA